MKFHGKTADEESVSSGLKSSFVIYFFNLLEKQMETNFSSAGSLLDAPTVRMHHTESRRQEMNLVSPVRRANT